MGQRDRFIALAFLVLWAAATAARADVDVPKPGPRDTCPVCGMLVSKYPNWVALVKYRDGHVHYFDGAKDMFKYLQDYARFAPGHRMEDIEAIRVTEFYGLGKMDAHKAYYVVGSDVLGPMGHELVPLATKADAEEFLKDHKGRRILTFDQVSPSITVQVDDGKF